MSKKRYNTEELDSRLRFVVGITLAAVLFFTTIAILYALVFVTQPLGEQAENDKMFFSVLSSVATFITGALAGILMRSGAQKLGGQDNESQLPPPLPQSTETPSE